MKTIRECSFLGFELWFVHLEDSCYSIGIKVPHLGEWAVTWWYNK